MAGIQNNANNYVHPVSHPATMITEDSTHRWATDTEKSNWNDANSKKHTHGNLSLLETITQTLIDTWNTVSNKVDKITGKGLSTNDFDNIYKTKLDSISTGANKINLSTTNGNIQIDGKETTVYTHPGSGTNPHGTTKSDVGLGNVTNDVQVKRSEMGIAGGVATLDSNGVNAQAPKSHTHDDRYYTETECDTKYATKSEISQAGYGDMLKSVYDTNNNGIVDKAEDSNTVDGKNASDFAPSGYGLGGISARLNSPDLNNVISNGWYDCRTPTNYVPDIGSNWHKLLVIASADTNYVTQIAFSMVNQTSGSAWIREKRAGTWGNWIRILTSSKQCSWNDLKGV
ncbi:pyocin knob domain-containing protein [Clostridium sp. DMHC 10]|uniref:pyocin knob domain-containing protein n=1 Tax=Clostridium sp. DMHC 10 TaxID=747377 RepID=UPI00069D9B69|nr:pyocin knob domain-containing protein [Clostridium sp. DMHC 10]